MPNTHTLPENLTRLQNVVPAITDAILAKGGTVNQGDGLEDFVSNYISALGYDSNNDWILLPSEASGATENSAIGDYVNSGSGLRVACLGGRWNYGSFAGAFYWSCDGGSSYAGANVGARLMFIPQAA